MSIWVVCGVAANSRCATCHGSDPSEICGSGCKGRGAVPVSVVGDFTFVYTGLGFSTVLLSAPRPAKERTGTSTDMRCAPLGIYDRAFDVSTVCADGASLGPHCVLFTDHGAARRLLAGQMEELPRSLSAAASCASAGVHHSSHQASDRPACASA